MSQQIPSYDVTSDDRLWAALAYFFSPIVPIVLLFLEDKKNRPFIKAHNMQALLAGIALWVITAIVGPLTLGCGFLLWFVMLIPAFKAYNGKLVEIPVISNFVRSQNW
jgi:uncharacterized membrane protein